MTYNPLADFLAVVRQTPGGARLGSMPALDLVVSALARMGLFNLWVNPNVAPTSDVETTVWLKPSSTSWATEGAVFLYNGNTAQFEPATPELWQVLFGAANATGFQGVTTPTAVVQTLTTLLAVRRDNPGMTVLTLPSVATRLRELHIVDWSTNVAAHQIVINPAAGETIMQQMAWSVLSNGAQLGSVTLYPSIDLDGWIIAP